MTDQNRSVPGVPDYPLADSLSLKGAHQYKALFDDTRSQIVSLLLERAATTSELAQTLSRPKGTIGHHLKVLEQAGLVHVVRTKKVRALEAKYYGRTARIFYYNHEHEAVGLPQRTLARAASEIADVAVVADDCTSADDPAAATFANIRYARVPAASATEWAMRMQDLLVEFGASPPGGDTTYALVFGLYPTRRGALPDESTEQQ